MNKPLASIRGDVEKPPGDPPQSDEPRRSDRSRLIYGIVIAITITLISGLLHGRISQRWANHESIKIVGQQLNLFPERIGVWQQEATYELGDSAMELLQCQGYVHRGYRNQDTGDYIKLAVMVGPGAKMSIHVPEICYEASNFTLLGPRERFTVDAAGEKQTFWSVRFQINDVSERRVQVLYGWSTGGPWMAPKMPRWSVAGYPVLYKLQLSHVVNEFVPNDAQRNDELLRAFMRDALDVLHRQMNDSPPKEDRSRDPVADSNR